MMWICRTGYLGAGGLKQNNSIANAAPTLLSETYFATFVQLQWTAANEGWQNVKIYRLAAPPELYCDRTISEILELVGFSETEMSVG